MGCGQSHNGGALEVAGMPSGDINWEYCEVSVHRPDVVRRDLGQEAVFCGTHRSESRLGDMYANPMSD